MVWGASMLRIHASFEKSPLVHEINLGKSWACKHWNFQKKYFVIFLHVFCIFFCIWVCHFGFTLSFFFFGHFVSFLSCFLVICCHFFVIFCHLFVIVCHFGNGKMEKKSLKHDYHDRPFTLWQHQIQGTGCLPWEIRFLGLPGRGVVSRPGVQGRLKNRVGGPGPGWNGREGAAQAREAGPTWKLQKRNFTSTRVMFFAFFCIFFAFFFCIFFLHFPD